MDQKTEIHSYIKCRIRLNIDSKQIFNELFDIYGPQTISVRTGRQHSFVEIDHEIFSTVILSLPLIQEGQLSVSGERMCTILVNRLED